MNKLCKEFVRILERNGYSFNRAKGSHFVYTNGRNTISINKDLNRMVARRLIKENCLVA